MTSVSILGKIIKKLVTVILLGGKLSQGVGGGDSNNKKAYFAL